MANTPKNPNEDRDPPRRTVSDQLKGLNTTQIVLLAVGGVMLLGCCGVGGCMALIGIGSRQAADQEQKEVASAPAISMSADALHADYDANEVAADGKYKGKVVEVSGTVKEIGKGAFGGQYVSLTLSKNQFMTSVRCEFPKSAEAELAKLTKGQRVTIRGKCDGFTLSTVRLESSSLR